MKICVNSIKDDVGNIKKEKVNLILNFLEFAIETGINENYFTTNTIQNVFELINKSKEVFPNIKSPLISVSKNKYPETYSFLNTMIDVINFDSFKDNDDFKTYYDRNDKRNSYKICRMMRHLIYIVLHISFDFLILFIYNI